MLMKTQRIATYATLAIVTAYLWLLFLVGARPQDISSAVTGLAAGSLPLTLPMALRGLRAAYRGVTEELRHIVLVALALVLAWTGIGLVSVFEASITDTLEFRVGLGLGVLLGLMWLVVDAWRD